MSLTDSPAQTTNTNILQAIERLQKLGVTVRDVDAVDPSVLEGFLNGVATTLERAVSHEVQNLTIRAFDFGEKSSRQNGGEVLAKFSTHKYLRNPSELFFNGPTCLISINLRYLGSEANWISTRTRFGRMNIGGALGEHETAHYLSSVIVDQFRRGRHLLRNTVAQALGIRSVRGPFWRSEGTHLAVAATGIESAGYDYKEAIAYAYERRSKPSELKNSVVALFDSAFGESPTLKRRSFAKSGEIEEFLGLILGIDSKSAT